MVDVNAIRDVLARCALDLELEDAEAGGNLFSADSVRLYGAGK